MTYTPAAQKQSALQTLNIRHFPSKTKAMCGFSAEPAFTL